jgi:FkbM family methyltransferase
MKPGLHQLRYILKTLRWLPPEMPGKARLARRLLGSYLDTKETIVNGRSGIRYIIPSLREPVGFYLFVDGVYEVQAIDFVLKSLKPGAVFVDIGANIGAFTLPAARKVGRTGRVIAVEPSPRIFPYLERNVALNELSNVRLIQCAAFNRDGETVPFYEAPVDHFGMGSLGAQFYDHPVTIPCHTLDHILNDQRVEKVDVIKVDVEGFEAAVFQGTNKLLTCDDPPLVLFEFCDWAENRVPGGQAGDAQRVLRHWGYRIWRLRDMLHNRPALADVLTTGFETLVASKNWH